MALALWLISELVGLFLLSRWLTNALYRLFLLIFRTRSIAMSLITLILFPGTVIHELAHLFTAEILGVRTGKLTLAPESIQEQEIKTGSVAISHTGPFRRALIGLAPLLVGLTALAALSYALSLPNLFSPSSPLFTLGAYQLTTKHLLIFYLLFAISNSMFPSSVDLRGTWQLMVAILAVVVGATYAGFRIALTGAIFEATTSVIASLSQSLLIVLAVNGILLLIPTILVALISLFGNRMKR